MVQQAKIKIVQEMSDEYLLDIMNNKNIIYVKPGIYAMSTRKIESLIKIAKLQKYYQCNPVRFISDFFGIELIDAQAWIVQRSWNCPNVLVVATRGLGKSTVIDLILMSKGMLFNNFWSYIASGSGGQAEQTFTTLERLANDNIDEMVGSSGYIFKDEIEVKNAAGDGFSHMPGGFTYSLYNGSMTQTLNSNVDAKRGRNFYNYIYMNKSLMEEIINMEKRTVEQENYLKENYKTKMYCDISNEIGKSEGAIRAKCFDLGLAKRNSWTDEEIDYIKENYQRLTIKQMAEHLNRTPNAVKLKAQRNGCSKYPYNCDYDFFKTIDTNEKAYWLGFIYADGYVSVNNSTNSGCVGIELQALDVEHLKKFNKSINGNYQISFREKQCKLQDNEKFYNQCALRIFSINMACDLINLGATTDKTYTMQLPNLSYDLMPHFIRGYFDGDGCISTSIIKNKNRTRCSFYSVSKKFLEQLRALLKQNGINSYLYIGKDGNSKYKDLYRLEIADTNYTDIFLNYIYNEASIYLDRKYERYIKYLSDTQGLAI